MGRLGETARAFRSALGNVAIRRLELAWAGANLGTWAYAVGVAVFAYEQGGAKAVGIVGFARWGAAAVLAPWLSALGDRHPRRRVMVGADLVRASALALAAAAVWAAWPPLLVYVLTGVVAAAASAFHPAEAALRPALVRSPEELTAANVVSSTIAAVGSLAGPALGGAVLAVSGAGAVFAVSAAALLWSALLVIAIPTEEPTPAGRADTAPFAAAAFAGFAAILADRRLRLVMGLLTAQLLVNGTTTVLVVVVAVRVLGLGGAGVGWLNTGIGVGAIAGAGLAAALVGRRRLGRDLAAGLLLYGAPFAAIAAAGSTAPVLLLLALVGAGATVAEVAGMTLLQRAAPEDVLARVFGVLETVILVTLGVGALLAPGLIDLIGVRGTLVAVGAFLPVLVAAMWRGLAAIDRETAVPERELALLRRIPIFAPLAPPELERLARALLPLELRAGAEVVRQGDAGDRFYVVEEGSAMVEVDGAAAGTLGPGGFFGEVALLRDVPRTATVRAVTPLRLFALERAPFLAAVVGDARSSEAAEQVVVARLARPVRA